MNWYLKVLKNYAVFQGRARRKEYWFFILFNLLISILLGIVDAAVALAAGVPIIGLVYALAVLLPALAVTVRRLHDTDRSGWWVLISVVPLIGPIVLIVFAATEGTRGPNRFGDDPVQDGAPVAPSTPSVAPTPVAEAVPPAAAQIESQPAAAPQAQHSSVPDVVLSGFDEAGQQHRVTIAGDLLAQGAVAVGRNADVSIEHIQVSRSHFSVAWSGHGLSVTDNNSTNGTAVNGRMLDPGRPVAVLPGDQLTLGTLKLHVEFS